VLIWHHPQFWYSIFNFDDGVNLRQKISYLREIGTREFSIGELVNDILWTIFLVIVGYLIVLVTRTLSMWIEFRLMPMITKKIVSENLVMRTEYDDVVKERNEYSEKYEEQRKAVRIMSRDYDAISAEANNKNIQINEFQAQITNLNNSVSKEKNNANKWKSGFEAAEKKASQLSEQVHFLTLDHDKLKEENEDFNNFFFRVEGIFDEPITILREAISKAKEMKSKKRWKIFLEVGEDIVLERPIRNLDNIAKLGAYHVIMGDIRSANNYEFTVLGRVLWNYREQFGADEII
jgi:uncharacterized coiled-coil DUF342 family protein